MPPASTRRLAPLPTGRVRRIAHFRAALLTFLASSEQTSRAAGLTPRWYLVLLFVKGANDGSERLNFSQLADCLKLSRNAVTELVARVESAGLVQRKPSPDDGRVVYLELTREGERRLAAAIQASERDRKQLAEQLSDLTELYRVAADEP